MLPDLKKIYIIFCIKELGRTEGLTAAACVSWWVSGGFVFEIFLYFPSLSKRVWIAFIGIHFRPEQRKLQSQMQEPGCPFLSRGCLWEAGGWGLVGFPGLCWPHPPFPARGEGCLSPSPPFYSTERILEVRGWAPPASSSKEPSGPTQWSSTNLNKYMVPTLVKSSYYLSHFPYCFSPVHEPCRTQPWQAPTMCLVPHWTLDTNRHV